MAGYVRFSGKQSKVQVRAISLSGNAESVRMSAKKTLPLDESFSSPAR